MWVPLRDGLVLEFCWCLLVHAGDTATYVLVFGSTPGFVSLF